jgi:sulfotransferase
MSGLPRSGSTLLCSLLNQRNDVYCSPLSYAADLLSYINLSLLDHESYRAGYREPRNTLLKNLFQYFYADKNVSLVIDKSRLWGNPYTRNILLQNLNCELKFICPVRPLDEIVSSFIKLANNNESNYIDRCMIEEDFLPYWRKEINDARTDWLLKTDGQISTAMLSLSGAFEKDFSQMYHIIQYKDICENTITSLRKLESFLELSEFDYDLNNIKSLENNDLEVFGIPKMHHVKPSIIKSDLDSKMILSDYAYNRCKLEDFWTEKIK